MGIDAEEFAPGVRASMNGEVAGPVTYPEWFADQPKPFQKKWLGANRFARFDAGELELEDFAQNLRILPIDELPATSLNLADL